MRQESSCGVSFEIALQTNHAANYANQLLQDLGERAHLETSADHPAVAWRRSGLSHITGHMCPLPLASHADGALMALKAISENASDLPAYGSQLLGERALMRGIRCKGRHNAGGSAQILKAKDGCIALNLAREDDWDLMPAWLGTEMDSWKAIAKCVRQKETDDLVSRGIEMGLALSKSSLPERSTHWFAIKKFKKGKPKKSPLIVDMSGLWAAPLASNLLEMNTAKVVKVESPTRPDGMRRGHKGFYDLINAGKDCVAIDFKTPKGFVALKNLLIKADVVIEASRPRAMEQLGIFVEDFVMQKPGMIWARLTAYGRSQNRIGFGDDISVSAGLSSVMGQTYGVQSFVGDAIADPMSGLHMVLAIQQCLNQGGGAILDFSMCDILRYAMGDMPDDLIVTAQKWQTIIHQDDAPFYQPRQIHSPVKSLGEDNAVWLC